MLPAKILTSSITFVFISLGVISCTTQIKTGKSLPESEQTVTNHPADNIYSPGARMLIHDYKQAMSASNSGPGPVFIEKYSLVKIDSTYYVGVLAKVGEHFNPDDLIPLKAITGSKNNGALSLKIPAADVERLGSVKGVEYIDISRRISLKNDQ